MKKTILYKMFGVIKKVLAMEFLASSVNYLKFVVMKNQKCKVRKVIVNNEYMLYPFSMKLNKCNGNCNNINNPYSRVSVPNVIKNFTSKLFDLMSWKNKTKQIKWHDSCKCECRLNPIICSNKQKWNKDRYRCECKKLVHKKYDHDFVWNPSSCKCEYKKKAAHLSVKECKDEIVQNITQSVKKYNKTLLIKEYNSCKPYDVSSILFLLVSVIITGTFVYFYVNSQSKRKLQTWQTWLI